MTEQLLTVKDAAAKLQVREGFIRLQIRTGRLPAISFGRHVGYRIHPDDLARFLAERITIQQTDVV